MVSTTTSPMIRLAGPAIEAADLEAVTSILRSGWLVQGDEVRRFEADLASLAGVPHAIVVSSGTAALHLGLLSLDLEPGAGVAVPAFSWPATANVVVLSGLRPWFVDIEPTTMAMDPAGLDRLLRSQSGIRAVVPVHPFGRVASMPALMEVAGRHRAQVLEDAACAIGARTGDRPAGSWGEAGCFSFHPRKVVTTGEGGAVLTRDAGRATRIRLLRNHGLDPRTRAPAFIAAGFNYRMTEFQAALGRSQLARLPAFLARRRRIADWYREVLAAVPVQVPPVEDPESHNFQSYVVLLPIELSPHRARLLEALRESGVEAGIGTHHIPLTPYYRDAFGYHPGDFPVTDRIAGGALSLPMHHGLERAHVEQVGAALTRSLRDLR